MGRRAGSRLEDVLVSRCLEPLRHRLAAGPPRIQRPPRRVRHLQVREGALARAEGILPVDLVVGDEVHDPPRDAGDRRWRSRREVTFVRPATSPVWVRPDGPGVRHRAPEVLRVGKPCPVPGLMEAVGCPGRRSPRCLGCSATGTLRLVVLRQIAAILPVEDDESSRSAGGADGRAKADGGCGAEG